jgi:hypothetical protein
MQSAIVKRFNCPHCSAQTELYVSSPLVICCAACERIFQVEQEIIPRTQTSNKKNLQPIETIKLEATGKYIENAFQIIGHIRSINSTSISNQWLMKFNTGDEKWLIENGFSYFVFESIPIHISSERMKGKKIGSTISIKEKEYTIIELSKQLAFEMEGQIPASYFNATEYFKYEAISRIDNEQLSICIFDKERTAAFKGVKVALETLHLSTLTAFKNWI